MRRALNRERTNIGRAAYADRIKQILLACTSRHVAECLVENLTAYQKGTWCEELNWVDVGTYAAKILNASDQVIFMTSNQSLNSPDTVDREQKDGYRVIPIPENIAGKIRGEVDVSGNPMVDVEHYNGQWNESFRFEFIEADQLTTTDRAVTDSPMRSLNV